jgi:2-hydroxychromene-2-carboxylate isomerase
MPMVLGGLFQAQEITPPHGNPLRRRYLFQDLQDLAAFYGLPYTERKTFLFKPILALRATLAVPQGEERGRAVHALFRGAFAEDRNLEDPAVVAGLLSEAGLDGPALVARTGEQAIKDALRQHTDEAIARNIFGAPTILVDDAKMFWGQDRLPLLEHYLKSS